MTSPRAFPIRQHLFLFSLLVLGPTLFMSGVVTLRYARSAQVSIEDVAQDRAADLQRALDRQADVAVASLKALATSPAIAAGDWATLQAQARAIPHLAAGVLALYGEADSPAWTSSGGDATADGPAVRALWQAAPGDEARREVAFSGFQRTGEGASVRIVVPVRQAAPQAGLLVWTVGTGVFAGSLPELDADWLAVVTDRDYRVLARSRDGATFVGRQASPDFSSRLEGRSGFVASRTLDGVDVVTAYQRSPVTGWIALVSVPQSVFARPLRALLWSLGGLIATGAIVSVAAGFAYSRYLGRDLHALSEDAAAVAQERPVPPVQSRVSEVAAVHRAMADAARHIAEARNQQRVLLAELNHRVKNTLAVIQTLISRTVTSGRSPEEAGAALRGRVGALAAAHDALSDSDWRDPDLRHVITRVLGPRVSLVDLDGPAIALRPRTVVALSQALHEVLSHSLAAGALRRGAHVHLAWTWSEGTLTLRWSEPPGAEGPEAPPSGFAATVIQLCIERQLGGRTTATTQENVLVLDWTIPGVSELGVNLSPALDRGAAAPPEGASEADLQQSVAE